VELTIYRCRRRAGEVATGGNWWLNGLQAIDGWGWLRIGLTQWLRWEELRRGGSNSRCRVGRWKWSKAAGFRGGATGLDDVK
jgi:hypothetical protein